MRGLSLCLFAALVAAAYGIAPLQRAAEKIQDEYLIMIDESLDVGEFGDRLTAAFANRRFKLAKILNSFKNMKTLHAELSDDAVEFIRRYEGVVHVEENGVARTQKVMSWGLDRIDQKNLPLDESYSPDSKYNGGKGVHVYVIDTGIWHSHEDFGGRAYASFDAIGRGKNEGKDCNGHGTHCAGTVGGNTYGVAKNATIHGIRVLGCLGSGTYNNIIKGMEWVLENGNTPGVVSMSLGGGASTTLDVCVEKMYVAGFTVSVAAGNSNTDACNTSPARSIYALTVGATYVDYANGVSDTRADFSNYGSCVDIFAPGVDITSAWKGSNNATNTISGTSMACPHVSGAAALILGEDASLSPSKVTEKIYTAATIGYVKDARSEANLLLYVGEDSEKK